MSQQDIRDGFDDALDGGMGQILQFSGTILGRSESKTRISDPNSRIRIQPSEFSLRAMQTLL